MNDRPDTAVLIMIVTTIAVAVIAGFWARSYGLPPDQSLLAANLGFAVSCYFTTFGFRSVLMQSELYNILKNDGKQEVDLSDLCGTSHPCKPAAEKIWAHKNLSRWVLIKTYASETKSIFEKITNTILYAILFVVAVAGLVLLVWNPSGATPSTSVPLLSTATSVLSLLTTFMFTVVRVYIPLLETAQRNSRLLTES